MRIIAVDIEKLESVFFFENHAVVVKGCNGTSKLSQVELAINETSKLTL